MEGEYYKVYQRSVFLLLRLKENLVAESFSPATLFAGPREVERERKRESRVGKLFLANSICQMETKRYSGIALNNTALLLPAESLSFSLMISSFFFAIHFDAYIFRSTNVTGLKLLLFCILISI